VNCSYVFTCSIYLCINRVTISNLTKKFPSLNLKSYLEDFYDNKHYFIEAYEYSEDDYLLCDSQQSSVTSIQQPEFSMRNGSSEIEESKHSEHPAKSIVVKADIEKDEGSSKTTNEHNLASGSLSYSPSSAADSIEGASDHDSSLVITPGLSSSASDDDQSAIVPVQSVSASVSSDVSEGVGFCGSSTLSAKSSSQDDTRYTILKKQGFVWGGEYILEDVSVGMYILFPPHKTKYFLER